MEEEEKEAPKRKKPKKTSEKMGFDKYIQYYGGEIHRYTVAYLQPKYRGTMKTKDEWDAQLAPHIN